jgi:hypothetical protein
MINRLYEVSERDGYATVVTCVKEVALAAIDVATSLKFVFMGITADRASEVPKELRLLRESF